jgi:hypothetical protein
VTMYPTVRSHMIISSVCPLHATHPEHAGDRKMSASGSLRTV